MDGGNPGLIDGLGRRRGLGGYNNVWETEVLYGQRPVQAGPGEEEERAGKRVGMAAGAASRAASLLAKTQGSGSSLSVALVWPRTGRKARGNSGHSGCGQPALGPATVPTVSQRPASDSNRR